MTIRKPAFDTLAIHAGQTPDPQTGAVNVPLYLTSTFELDGIGQTRGGWDYSRAGNPTRDHLEESLCALEGGTSGHVFASGMAAIAALVTMLKTGDHVICSNNVYGGTQRLFSNITVGYGIEIEYVDTSDLVAVDRALKPTTKLVHVETPTNPLMHLTDLQAITDLCHSKGVEVSVDNTFLSPYFQSPIEFGADIVMHSTTKFLNGHSDGLGGVLVGTKPEHRERFHYVQKCTGGILSPFECFLVLRGVKTLGVRMRQHEENGHAVSEFLAMHPKVQKVFYPGLSSHPQHELAKQQQRGFGSMMAIETGSQENAAKLMKALKLCTVAESLGGVETLVSHSASTTHFSVPPEIRLKLGITDGLVRFSIGIEDKNDLIADIEQALAAI